MRRCRQVRVKEEQEAVGAEGVEPEGVEEEQEGVEGGGWRRR